MPPSTEQSDPYSRAAEKFALACKLESIESILSWDAQTNMPKAGAWARGEQAGALAEIKSNLTGSREVGDLLDEAQSYANALSDAQRANLSEMRRIWLHRIAVPPQLLVERARHSQALQSIWVDAKANSDFEAFAPGFKRLLAIHKEVASAKAATLGLSDYDAMLDEHDPGLTTATIDPIYDDLASELPAILAEARERQANWPAVIPFSGDFSVDRQAALSMRLSSIVGHSTDTSRIDTAAHPFSMPHSPGDVRFTTRYHITNFRTAVTATLHEAGHSMYELNLPRDHAFSPAGFARGASMHESQSLMLEMMAGRSKHFLAFLAPLLHEHFGGDAACWSEVNVLNFFRRIDDDFIRVEADEISYPLHVILRYRLERSLLSGDLSVDDLPGAWNEMFENLFGRVPPNHTKGCLQDIHWAAGMFGYFPNYALGEALAAQLFERAQLDDATIGASLRKGDFEPYFKWVRPRIHEQASLRSFDDIVVGATSEKLSGASLKRHLRKRYLIEPMD